MPSYSEEEATQTEKMWREGYSASQIADVLGNGRTRNSVIGFIYRHVHGSPRRSHRRTRSRVAVASLPPKTLKQPAAAAQAPAMKRVEPAPALDTAGQPALLLRLEDMKHGQCRFACNQAVRGEEHLFCGHPVWGTSAYCAEHHRLCYVPSIEKSIRKRANVVYLAGL